jgi:hypothetical protein
MKAAGNNTTAAPRASSFGSRRLPPELRAQLRRLVAQLLIADLRVNPLDFRAGLEPTVASRSGRNRGDGEAA